MYKYKNKDVFRIYRGGSLLYDLFSETINTLYKNNEQGFFYDPNDLSTMYQDAAGTNPVTAVGQPVGLMKDKSGRNNHASQTVSASRPILRKNAVTGANYLEFDGADDYLQTNNIDFSATDKVSLFTGVTNLAVISQIIAELSSNANTNNGAFYLSVGTGGGYTTMSRGTGSYISNSSNTITYPTPDVAVLSLKHDISGDMSIIRRNGVAGIESAGDKGAGNFGNYPLFIGRRAGTTLPFNGHVYGLIGIGKLVSDTETAVIEKELAKRVGVTLNV